MARPTSNMTRQGVVKSWNGSKGFGFLTAEGLGVDVMFARTELPEDHREVRGKFLEGNTVSFQCTSGPDGRLKATSLQVIAAEGTQLAGVIKTHSERHGYGFISSSSLTEDVHFFSRDLSGVSPGVKIQGELVVFDMAALPDGKLRASKVMFQSGKIAERLGSKGSGMNAGVNAGMNAGMMAAMSSMGIPAAWAQNIGAMAGLGAKGKGKGRGSQNQAMSAMASMGGDDSDAMDSSMQAAGAIVGCVKSFSEQNGYGFLNVPGQSADLKFGKADLQCDTVSKGDMVYFSVEAGLDGRMQAKMISPKAGGAQRQKRPAAAAFGQTVGNAFPGAAFGMAAKKYKTETSTGQQRQGSIKSYNSSKGFGFINASGVGGDVFFMRSSLPDGLQEMDGRGMTGQAVRFEVMQASDGQMRAGNISMA